MFGIKKDKQRLHANFRIGRIIGDGNFAIVRECVHRKTNKRYALKIINKAKVKGKENMIENEIHILRKIIHPNIVKLHEEFETTKEIYLVMELVAGGDLFDSIVTHTRFTEPCSAFMIRDLASAVNYLHDLNIVHRDIKPENLLVVNRKDGRRSLKLADFGLSMEVDGPMFLVCGTPTYVAPEILDESGYGLKVDVWAIGVILYILLCGFPPFRSVSHDQEELFDRIMRGDYEYLSPFWDDVSEGPKDLIDSLLKVDADDRYSPEQVLSHEWIRKWVEPFDTEVTTAAEKSNPTRNRKSLRGISIAIQSLICLLKLVRSRRENNLNAAPESQQQTSQTSTTEPLSTNDAIKADNGVISPPHTPVSVRSRIPRPKPSAGFHIAEIRKSIVTPTRGKREPDCALKNGILKRDEAIRRVSRSESTRLYHVKTNSTVSAASKYARLRPSSAASIKRNSTNETEIKRPCNPRLSKPSPPVQTDQDIQALLHKKLYGDTKIFGHPKPYGDTNTYNDEKLYEENKSYGDNTTDEEKAYEENKAKYPDNTAIVLTTKVIRKPSMDKTKRELPIRKSSTRFRPRSMLGDANTVKSSSEMNISSRATERNIHEGKKSYDGQKSLSNKKRPYSGTNSNRYKFSNNNKQSSPTTSSPTKFTSGYHCSGSDEDQICEREYQLKCECPSSSRTANQTSTTSPTLQIDVYNHSNDMHGNSSSNCSNDSLNSNETSNAVRKNRSSCRKTPSRKPVCRHASSIQSMPTEKYTPRRGLYRVKSLESNHIPSLNHGATSISVGVETGAKGYRTYHENGFPPWNPSTNLNNRFIPCSPREQQHEKKNSPGGGIRAPRGLESKGLEPKCTTKATTEADKGIKITTEVNKRKNTKFPDGKTVDEEVKTTTTVSVNLESPEEEKETSLLTKVKNLAHEIGTLAKETYKLSQSSDSSDSLEKEISVSMGAFPGNAVGSESYTAENGRDDSSDFNDDSLASNKEETDIHSETEYLSSVFRKK